MEGVFFRAGRTHAGRLLAAGTSLRAASRGIEVTDIITALAAIDAGVRSHIRLQNSSIKSPERCPQMYRPLNRLSNPTHERRASRPGAMRGCIFSGWQHRSTATNVRPAAVS